MKNLLIFCTYLVIILSAVQGFVPSMPVSNPNTLKYVSAVILCLTILATAWKQFASAEISNASLIPTLLVALTATIGGITDLAGKLPFDAHTAQWIRFGLTAFTAILNVFSSTAFSSVASCIVGFLFLSLFSSCSMEQSILRGGCTIHEFSAYEPGTSEDSIGIYVVCNNKTLVKQYPNLAADLLKAAKVQKGIISK